ncbi:MAG: hypothetical protein QXF41_03125 [Candidatus Micrarchaeaceae archaeon]
MIVDFGNLSYSLQTLVSNLIQIQQNYYNLFINPNPQYVQIDNIDPVTGDLITLEVPNWAMLMSKTLYILDNIGSITDYITSMSLQQVYDQSPPDPSNSASISLTDKSLRIYNQSNTSVYFGIDYETGNIFISGSLYVNGESYTTNSTISNENYISLTPISSSSIPISINPQTPLSVPAMQVSVTNDGPSVFSILPNGVTNIAELLVNTNSTINGSQIVLGTITAENGTSANQVVNYSQMIDGSLSPRFNNIYGTLTQSYQPNITELGTLTGLTVNGNISATSITGTITTPNQPDITSLGTLTGLSVNGTISANDIAGILITPNQPNITSLGTLTGLSVNGTISANDISGMIITSNQPDITSLGTLTNLTVNGNSQLGESTNQTVKTYHNTLDDGSGNSTFQNLVSNFVGINGNFNGTYTPIGVYGTIGWNITGGNAEIDLINNFNLNNIYTGGFSFYQYNGTSNVLIASITGSGNLITNTISGTLTTSNQPNITSVGTLTELTVTGTITAANGTSGNQVINYSQLTNGSLSPNFSSITGTITTPNQPDITSLGTLTGLNVNGNSILSNSTTQTVKTYNNILDDGYGNVIINGNFTSPNITGIITTPNQPNITSLGVLTNLISNGTISAANGTSGNQVVNYNQLTNGSLSPLFNQILRPSSQTNQNWLPNSSFLFGITGWNTNGIDGYWSIGTFNNITYWQYSGTTTQSQTLVSNNIDPDWIQSGVTCTLSAWINNSYASNTAVLQLNCYNSSGSFINSIAISDMPVGTSGFVSASGMIPPYTSYVQVCFQFYGLSSGSNITISQIKLELGNVATQWSDESSSTLLFNGSISPVFSSLSSNTISGYDGNNITINYPILTGYMETQVNTSNVQGEFSLIQSSGNVQQITLAGNTTLTLYPVNTTGHACTMILMVKQPSSGGPFTITWPEGTLFPNGTSPIQSTTPNAIDVYKLILPSSSANWMVFPLGMNMI